jgi:16S rRNA U1498 N3-methylase RsmE
MKIIKEIKRNLRHHNATVTKADKGQTLIIIDQTEQNTKTQLSLTNNHFQITHKYPTNMFQKEVIKATNSCPILIPHDTKWKYTVMNPQEQKSEHYSKFTNQIPPYAQL